jgi:2,4-dichlorophenol 6-monooxygenase
VGDELGIDLAAYVIGPGREFTDLYDDWARLREVGEDGCVLVRPDAHVAWRSAAMVDDPDVALTEVLMSLLDRGPGEPAPEPTDRRQTATAI